MLSDLLYHPCFVNSTRIIQQFLQDHCLQDWSPPQSLILGYPISGQMKIMPTIQISLCKWKLASQGFMPTISSTQHYAKWANTSYESISNTAWFKTSDGSPSKINFMLRCKKKDNVLHDELEEYFKLTREEFDACGPLEWWLRRWAPGSVSKSLLLCAGSVFDSW